jgi:hypothetical protein
MTSARCQWRLLASNVALLNLIFRFNPANRRAMKPIGKATVRIWLRTATHFKANKPTLAHLPMRMKGAQ